ncbi:MAG: hypothetical protein AAGD28_17725, partial [Bacteroidota bacterium]
FFLTSQISCTEESKSADPEQISEEIDSLSESLDNSRSLAPASEDTGISLMGKWQLVERKMGVQVLEMLENDESTLEFKSDGTLVSESDGFEPESVEFTRIDEMLSSDLWDTSQSIKTLTEDELVLVYQVDGVDIDHIYKRVK